MKGLIDTNVVLDVLLARSPWVTHASALWKACDEGRFTGYLSAISPPTIFYIIRKAAGADKAREAIHVCLLAFEVCAVDRGSLEEALMLSGADFEDNIQISCAIAANLDVIVSRDPRGLANARIPVLNPEEMLLRL